MLSCHISAESDECVTLLQVDVLRRMQGRAEALRLLAVYEVKHHPGFKHVQAGCHDSNLPSHTEVQLMSNIYCMCRTRNKLM